jgi:hypothetical protein
LGRKLKNDIRWLVARAEREHYAALSIVLVKAVREVLGDVDVYVFGSAVMTMTVMSVAIMISTSSIELHPSSAKLSSTNSSTNNLSLTF